MMENQNEQQTEHETDTMGFFLFVGFRVTGLNKVWGF